MARELRSYYCLFNDTSRPAVKVTIGVSGKQLFVDKQTGAEGIVSTAWRKFGAFIITFGVSVTLLTIAIVVANLLLSTRRPAEEIEAPAANLGTCTSDR